MSANQFGDSTFPIILGQVNDGTITRNVTQTFLTQSVSLETVYRDAADRIFFFGAYPGPLGGPTGEIGQLATHNFIFEDCSNKFFDGANANVAGRNWQIDVTQYIGFTDRKFHDPVPQTIFSRFATSPASSRAGVVTTANASNAFSWNDHDGTGSVPLYDALKRTYLASNSLGFTQTLTNAPEVGDLFDQVFVTGQTLDTVGTVFGDDTAQTFLKQHVTFSVSGAQCPEKEYTPFVGESGDATYPAVSTTPPTLGSGVLTLTHPRVTPTLTLTLRNPEFGNTDTVTFTKVDRVTRGGDRKFFSDSGWGSTQSFELEIRNVCATTATIDEIITFLNTSLGEEIGLLDWENRQWKGIIVVPETDVIPRVGGHGVRIVFEGELV
jgi:hypothetical protein